MNTKWPSSCCSAVSNVAKAQNIHQASRVFCVHRTIRSYAAKSVEQKSNDLERHEKAALVEIQGLRRGDPFNPPRSTRPPPLKLPERGDANAVVHLVRTGRAYGSFYWRGIKAVWFNHKAAKLLKEHIQKDRGSGANNTRSLEVLNVLTRSQFQLLERNSYDIGKLPFFGLLVAVFGEWLPLIVPFIPSAVPGTCRIPKQITDMRKKAEARRRMSYRMGIAEPEEGQLSALKSAEKQAWPAIEIEHARGLLAQLRNDQLLHVSSSLNLHSRLWDRFQITPPSSLLRRKVARHITYLNCDDRFLSKHPSVAISLELEEVHIACEERGLDVLGKSEEHLRTSLHNWLEVQQKDQGSGQAIMRMLFRRPHAWDVKGRL